MDVTGAAVINGKAYSAKITLLPSLNLAKSAYIKDTDGDGRGDKVYIVFTRPLEELPASVTPLYWNQFGPVIMTAKIHPFNNLTVTPGGVELDVDTLFNTVSEQLRTRTDWQELIRVGPSKDGKCNDYASSTLVIPYGQPKPVPGNDTAYMLLINQRPRVYTNECVYMNVNGNYTDLVQNLPPVHAVKVTGERPPEAVRMQGFPPVAGLNANNPGFVMVNNDPRGGGVDGEFSKLNGTTYQTVWVPPADWPSNWVPNSPANIYAPDAPRIGDAIQEGRDLSEPSVMPSDIGAMQVVATSAYIANVAIFDNLGNFVQSFTQSFGFRGELANSRRKADKGMVSYLVRNLKNSKGRKVGNGVYIWKAVFMFKTGKQEIKYVRTGVTRNLGN